MTWNEEASLARACPKCGSKAGVWCVYPVTVTGELAPWDYDRQREKHMTAVATMAAESRTVAPAPIHISRPPRACSSSMESPQKPGSCP